MRGRLAGTAAAVLAVGLFSFVGVWLERVGGSCVTWWVLPLVLAVRDRPRGSTPAKGSSVAVDGLLVGVLALGAVLGGLEPAHAVRVAVVDVAVAAAYAAVHRALVGRSWIAAPPRHLAVTVATVIPASVALVRLGGLPRLGPAHPVEDIVCVFGATTAGVLCVGGLISAPVRGMTMRPTPFVGPLVLVAAGSVLAPYFAPDLTITWLVLIPAVWGGLVLTRRPAALLVAGEALLLTVTPLLAAGSTTKPPAGVMELALAASSLLMVTLITYREKAAVHAEEIRERAEREAIDTALLDDVITSMDDGVLVTEDDRIVLTNPSARRLLGVVPADIDLTTWLTEQGCHTEGSHGLDAETVEVLRHPPDGGFVSLTVLLPSSGGRGTRRYDVAVRAITAAGRRLGLVIVTDGTTRAERMRELESFAGTVAQNLRTPLSAVHRWIDSATRHLELGQGALARAAIGRADLAATRMRATIDDYLADTLAREGVLRLGRVVLAELAPEVLDEARHHHDVTDPVDAATGVMVDGDGPDAEGALEDVTDPVGDVDETTVDVPHIVHADATLVRRLLANLVTQVMSYRTPGVPYAVRVRSIDDEPGWARLVIEGEGAEAPGGDQEASIFGGFGEDTGPSRPTPPGLGSDLCRTIVRRHGGDLFTTSTPRGCRIEVTLPVAERTVVVDDPVLVATVRSPSGHRTADEAGRA